MGRSNRGSRGGVKRNRVLAVGVSTTMALSGSFALASPASAAPSWGSSGCKPVELLAFPGTWETNSTDNPDQAKGMTAEVLDPVQRQFGTVVSTYTIPYVAEVGLIGGLAVGSGGTADYDTSKKEAIDKGVSRIRQVAQSCPNTLFGLTGYSQGADAAGDVAALIANGQVPEVGPDSIIGVALIADPARSGNSTFQGPVRSISDLFAPPPDGVNQRNKEILVGEPAPGQGMAGPRQLPFTGLENKVVSFCAPSDMACATPETDNIIRRVVQAGRSGGILPFEASSGINSLGQLRTFADSNMHLVPMILEAALEQDISKIPTILTAARITPQDIAVFTDLASEIASFAMDAPGLIQSLLNSSPEEIMQQITLAATYSFSHTGYDNFAVDTRGTSATEWIVSWFEDGITNVINGNTVASPMGASGGSAVSSSSDSGTDRADSGSDSNSGSITDQMDLRRQNIQRNPIDMSSMRTNSPGSSSSSSSSSSSNSGRAVTSEDYMSDSVSNTGLGVFNTVNGQSSNTKLLSEEEAEEEVEFYSLNTDGTRADVRMAMNADSGTKDDEEEEASDTPTTTAAREEDTNSEDGSVPFGESTRATPAPPVTTAAAEPQPTPSEASSPSGPTSSAPASTSESAEEKPNSGDANGNSDSDETALAAAESSSPTSTRPRDVQGSGARADQTGVIVNAVGTHPGVIGSENTFRQEGIAIDSSMVYPTVNVEIAVDPDKVEPPATENEEVNLPPRYAAVDPDAIIPISDPIQASTPEEMVSGDTTELQAWCASTNGGTEECASGPTPQQIEQWCESNGCDANSDLERQLVRDRNEG